MKKFKQIIESPTPPQGDSMWLDDAKLKYLKNGKWTSINDEKADVTELKKEVKDLTDTVNKKADTTALDTKADKTTVTTELNKKVDKVTGKGLSTNDFTTAEKEKLAGIEAGANKIVVDSAMSKTSENPVQNKAIQAALDNKFDTTTAVGAHTFLMGPNNVNGGKASFRIPEIAEIPDLSKVYQSLDSNGYQQQPQVSVLTVGTNSTNMTYIKASIPPFDTVSKLSSNWYFATDGTLQNLYEKVNVLDLLSYGVSWKPNVADPALTRVGNMTYHKTLPIQNNMKGCIAQMKDGAKIIYYLDPTDWRWKENPRGSVLKSQVLTVTAETYTITNDVFSTFQYENQWVKINNIPCQVIAVDTSTNTATIKPDSTIEAGTYDVELGAVLNGYDGEVMVEVPEFWIKSWDTDTKREVRITPTKIDDTWEHQPRLLVSAYHDTILNTVPENMGYLSTLQVNSAISVMNTNGYCRGGNNSSNYDTYLTTDRFRSMLGKPRTGISRANMRTNVRKAGKEILSYLQYKRVLYWLYIIEYANFNCQATFNSTLTSEGYKQGGLGDGVTDVNSRYWTYYNSNNPLTPNGYTNEFGNSTNIKTMTIIMPTASGGDPASSITRYVPRWHGIENPFGDIWNNVDGIIINSSSIVENGKNYSEVYATDDSTLYSDSNYKSMKRVGIELNEGGWIKEFDLGNTAEIIPRLNGGNITQYKCDYHWTNSSTGLRTLCLSGHAIHNSTAGLADFISNYGVGYAYADFGFRSSCELN